MHPWLALRFGTVVVGFVLSCCGGAGGPTGALCDAQGQALTYANFGQDFMANNCTTCHVTGARPRLDSQAAVMANAHLIDSVAGAFGAVVNTYMPADRSLPVIERQKLAQWLACGAR